MFSKGQDTNGNGMRIHQGFERLAPRWKVDLVALKQSWIRYPEQFGGGHGDRKRMAAKLARDADIVHFFNSITGWHELGAVGKPVIVHHHGTGFRRDHVNIAKGANAIGAVQVASTLDLVILEPGVHWLPAIYNLDELAALRARLYEPGERVRVAHAPTNRRIKGTDAVLEVIASFGDKIEFDLIERVAWSECLERLARADIVIDQLVLGSGSLAVEAWGMGVPVIAGIAPENFATRVEMLRRWGSLPFVEAQPDTLAKVLGRLVRYRSAREEAAAIGHAHARRYHDETAVVAQLMDIYDQAPPTRMPVSTWRRKKPWKAAA